METVQYDYKQILQRIVAEIKSSRIQGCTQDNQCNNGIILEHRQGTVRTTLEQRIRSTGGGNACF